MSELQKCAKKRNESFLCVFNAINWTDNNTYIYIMSYSKYFFYLHRCKQFKDNPLTICLMEGDSSVTQSKYSDGVYSGHVKWFNRTAGWGFLTLTGEGETSGDDIFVHWNSLSVDKEQYRYLVNGEYVSFKITFNKDAKHPYQAEEVRGVNGGNLMC